MFLYVSHFSHINHRFSHIFTSSQADFASKMLRLARRAGRAAPAVPAVPAVPSPWRPRYQAWTARWEDFLEFMGWFWDRYLWQMYGIIMDNYYGIVIWDNWNFEQNGTGIQWNSVVFNGISWYLNGGLEIFNHLKWWVWWGRDIIIYTADTKWYNGDIWLVVCQFYISHQPDNTQLGGGEAGSSKPCFLEIKGGRTVTHIEALL